jgi:hypothetical protein
VLVALATVLGTVSATTGAARAGSSEPGEVSGRVVDPFGAPVAGAVVHAAAQRTSVRTDDSGSFTLSGVPRDSAGVVAAKQGFSFAWHTLEPGRSGEVRLTLEPETPRTVPHPDYPRPDSDRRGGTDGRWLSLNGTWSLGFDPADVGLAESWQSGGHEWEHAVRVPFSHTSPAGLGEQSQASNSAYAGQFADVRGVVWQQRDVTVPADWPADRGVLLRFGAVEWHSRVFLDGVEVARHDGGYSPFDVDLGRLAPGSRHSLVVRAVVPDNSDRTPYPQGKQMGWYTDTGGIWQSVWLEPGDPARLVTTHVTPLLEFSGTDVTSARARVDVTANDPAASGTVRITVREQAGKPVSPPSGTDLPTIAEPRAGGVVATATVTLSGGTGSVTVDVPRPRLWSPEQPWLYRATAELTSDAGRDATATWFGLRSLTRTWAAGHSPQEQADPKRQYQYLNLNNRPIYLRSVLDQAFNPWGVYSYTGLYQGSDLRGGSLTEPRKGSVLFDLALAKQLGFNSTRLHIKLNDPLYYHWADVLGLMVWYDQPNFGYNGYSAEAERLYESVLRDAAARDHNHASIVVWDAFNEGWGVGGGGPIREDAKPWIERMTALTKELAGPGRLIVDNSPCCSNGHPSELTDLLDFHGYLGTWAEWRDEVERQADNAYPGSSFNMEEGKRQAGQPLLNSEFGPWSGGAERDQDVATPFRYTTELMRGEPKMNGYLFTELTDVEWEWNGWAAYDRTLQVPGYLDSAGRQSGVGAVNADDVLLFDAPPVQRVTGGTSVSLPVRASLFSGRAGGPATLRWRISGTDATGTALPRQRWSSREVDVASFTTADLGTVAADVPRDLRAGRFDVELVRGRDVLAGGQTALAEWSAAPTGVVLDPAEATADWKQGAGEFARDGATAAWGRGDGSFAWTVDAPADLTSGRATTAQLVLEASATRPVQPRTSYPQTSERRFPTTVEAVVDGVSTGAVVVPDAPADARGALSSEAGFDPSRYGYRLVLDLDARKLREAARDGKLDVRITGSGGGLTVFGPRTGRYGIAPQLVLSRGAGVAGPRLTGPEPYPTGREGAGVTTHLVSGSFELGTASPVVVRVVNDTNAVVRNVRPDLLVPQGWTAEPERQDTVRELRPGQAADLRYEVTPGSAGTGALTTRAFHDGDGGRAVSAERWTVSVPLPAPTPANYPTVDLADSFDADSSARYTAHQPFGGEAAPAPRVGGGALSVSSDQRFFSVVASDTAPSSASTATVVEAGDLSGGTRGENSLFAGLVRDSGTYAVLWYNHVRGETGFDVRVDGAFQPGPGTSRLSLRAGDRLALAVSGTSLTSYLGRDGTWTPILTGGTGGAIDLGDPAQRARYRHGAGLRGDGGSISIGSLTGLSR